MKKILFTFAVLGIIFTMSNCETDNNMNLSFLSDAHDSGTVPGIISFNSGDTITIPESDLVKDGYSLRWQLGDELYKAGDKITLNDNTVLTAVWAERLYRVTYDGKGQYPDYIPVDDNLYASGDKIRVKWNPILAGSGFYAWRTDLQLENIINVEGKRDTDYLLGYDSSIIIPERDIVLTAFYLSELY